MSKSPTRILPTPDFDWDPTTRPPIAGLRPYREQSYRLEPEVVGSKFVVHNYGHGGAGITMSWGCAHEVVDIVTAHGVGANDSVAVLGAGVMGLTAATLLLSRNLKVAIYAKEFPPNTTSNKAGGQWAPSLVNHRNAAQFTRILRRAFSEHKARGAAYGVSARENYTLVHASNFESCPPDVIPRPTAFAHLPFAHLRQSGFGYATLLVEPPIFLGKMHADLQAANVAFNAREFQDLSDVAGLTETIVVNCTGLGSKAICKDRLMHSGPRAAGAAAAAAQPAIFVCRTWRLSFSAPGQRGRGRLGRIRRDRSHAEPADVQVDTGQHETRLHRRRSAGACARTPAKLGDAEQIGAEVPFTHGENRGGVPSWPNVVMRSGAV